MNSIQFKSPLGVIRLEEEEGKIIRLLLLDSMENDIGQDCNSPVLVEAKKQIEDYFLGNRRYFELPIDPQGTEFQKKVWNALLTIPYGSVNSYKDIAHAIGNGKSCRAVGMANNKNPIPIMIPCHRVIGSNGSLVGYGYGLDVKRKLLDLESKDQTVLPENVDFS